MLEGRLPSSISSRFTTGFSTPRSRAATSAFWASTSAPPRVPQFDTHIATVAPPFRGTIAAGQGKAAAVRKSVVLNANTYGHFQAVAEIAGQQVEFMTDTGATYVALSYETAQKLGLTQNLRFNGRSTTANGVARVASFEIDQIRIGEIAVKGVQAVVAEPGRMTQNLLGMSFIRQLSGFELNGSTLTMRE